MKARLLSSALSLILLTGTALADGFLPIGGYTGRTHYAVEPVASGFKATSEAVVSHGSVSAASTHTSGVESISANRHGKEIFLSQEGGSLTVSGVAADSRCQIFGIDGRLLTDTRLTDGHTDISFLPEGHYLVRLLPADEAPVVNHFIKRR